MLQPNPIHISGDMNQNIVKENTQNKKRYM